MSAAIGAPVTVMKNAGEGGAWGIALLALFACCGGENFENFIDRIFQNTQTSTVTASQEESDCFNEFMIKYKKGLAVEKLASEVF